MPIAADSAGNEPGSPVEMFVESDRREPTKSDAAE
jgi:hypothetical protein